MTACDFSSKLTQIIALVYAWGFFLTDGRKEQGCSGLQGSTARIVKIFNNIIHYGQVRQLRQLLIDNEKTEGCEDWLTQLDRGTGGVEKRSVRADSIRGCDHRMRHLNFTPEVEQLQVMNDKVQDVSLGVGESK